MVKIWLCSIAVLLALPSCRVFGDTYADVTIDNATNENISRATLWVARHTYQLADIKPGDSRTISFTTAGDDSYRLAITFVSGRELNVESLGYVGEGMASRDKLRIHEGSVQLVAGTRPGSDAPLPLTTPSS
jgi:hypothetical protein